MRFLCRIGIHRLKIGMTESFPHVNGRYPLDILYLWCACGKHCRIEEAPQ